MTVSAATPYVKYACTGTDEYTYAFKIPATTDLLVKRISTTGAVESLVITSDYTVADVLDGTGGTVTTVSTYSDGHLSIELNLDYDQTTEFTDGGPLPADALENAFDKTVMLIKQLATLVSDGALGITWQGGWITDADYAVFDMVTNDGKWYACTTAHTSDVFADDLSNGQWRLFLEEPSNHTIGSHSDTTATGGELSTLTTGSGTIANLLHSHSILKSSGGDVTALATNAGGYVVLDNGGFVNEFSIDGTFADNSDYAVPTEKAVKTYVTANARFYDAYIRLTDQKAQNTNGGDFTQADWRKRDIQENADDSDTGSLCSVASDQITLAAGTYRCKVSCPAHNVDHHQARLYDTTGTAVLLVGTTEESNNGNTTRSNIVGRFTIASESTLEIQHYCTTTNSGDGFGTRANITTEVYTIAEFWREV